MTFARIGLSVQSMRMIKLILKNKKDNESTPNPIVHCQFKNNTLYSCLQFREMYIDFQYYSTANFLLSLTVNQS